MEKCKKRLTGFYSDKIQPTARRFIKRETGNVLSRSFQ
ncbi:hypothetical protein CIY_10730 [Butyrivibrio fibrisolvens 16/4]|nr:hypothetical protein CIY_10730 [Butyrivibrio fibrisolvens 16/4]